MVLRLSVLGKRYGLAPEAAVDTKHSIVALSPTVFRGLVRAVFRVPDSVPVAFYAIVTEGKEAVVKLVQVEDIFTGAFKIQDAKDETLCVVYDRRSVSAGERACCATACFRSSATRLQANSLRRRV